MTNVPQIIDGDLQTIPLPPEDVLTQLGVPAKDFGNFMKAFEVVGYQAQGKNLTQAAKLANIHRTRIYDPYWKDLINAARRLYMGYTMIEAANGAVLVAQSVPEIVQSMVNVAQFGARDMEKVQAATWLRDTYPSLFSPAEVSDDDQAHYVNSMSTRDYNPQMPLTLIAESGSVINITPESAKEAYKQIVQQKESDDSDGA